MLRATKDIFADKDNRIVAEPSTVSGTFKVAAAGGYLSEQDAAKYGINAQNMSEHGLEVAPATAPVAGSIIDNSAMNSMPQQVSMGAAPSQPAAVSSPAPGGEKSQPTTTSTQPPAAPKPAASPSPTPTTAPAPAKTTTATTKEAEKK